MPDNIFTDIPEAARNGEGEAFEELLTRPGIRIERIISTGQASPTGFWYCQTHDEWILILQGSAGLRFDTETDVRILKAGDFVNIPSLCRHRVEWTEQNGTTIWLAIHYGEKTLNEAGEAE
jgi:cupin 2 domain-containing protein